MVYSLTVKSTYFFYLITGADTPYYLATLPAGTGIKGAQVAKREVVEWK